MGLQFEPDGTPITKFFETPLYPNGEPVQISALQPLPFTIWENFQLFPGTTDIAVTDWHEQIVTPGWEWVLPGDPRFPGLFPANDSLITRDGLPWPSTVIPSMDPTQLSVEFPPIGPGHVLDVHKALLWVGTETQQDWTGGPNQAGIVVIEYPTPEPSSFLLAAFGLAGLWAWARRRRR